MSVSTVPSIEAQQDYYDKRWPEESERPNRLELWRLQEILKSLLAIDVNFAVKTLKICDLGCGRGWIASHLSSFGSVTAIDLSAEGIRQAQKKWPHIKFEQGDITSYRGTEKFDVVVSSEVIEHIDDKQSFFETARSLLKPGGHLIITTPNATLYPHYTKTKSELQPIENWPSVADMRQLSGPDFAVIRHETFMFDVFYSGIFRIISAPKLISACRALRIGGARMWLLQKFGFGLHQILHARLRR